MKSSTGSKNFHVPLSQETYFALRSAAEHLKRPATRLAREAIEYWLGEIQKETLKNEIEAYAKAVAGTRDDLDPDLENAGIEAVSKKVEIRKKKKEKP